MRCAAQHCQQGNREVPEENLSSSQNSKEGKNLEQQRFLRGGWNITQASGQTWLPGSRDHEVTREVRSVLQHATSLPLLLLAKVRRGGRHRRQEPLSQCLQIGRVKALGCTTGSTHPVKSILNDSVSQLGTHLAHGFWISPNSLIFHFSREAVHRPVRGHG